jgi:histidinol phosphatase-like enzyme
MTALLSEAGVQIDAVYICPHKPDACHCRRPEIGLMMQATTDFGFLRQFVCGR